MISVLTWKWGQTFGPEYVNRLRAGLARHLHLDHELVCATDDLRGLDGDIRTLPITEFLETPRCRRRMAQFSRDFVSQLGARTLGVDLDIVLVDDITPIVTKFQDAPIVGWKVNHAGVYSGSFLRFDAGALDPLYQRFKADPELYPYRVQPRGVPSDQAMLNAYLSEQPPIPFWTEADGFVTYYGDGYEHLEHFGVGPRRQQLPEGARIVVLGSADKSVMDEGRYPWVLEHWSSLEVHA